MTMLPDSDIIVYRYYLVFYFVKGEAYFSRVILKKMPVGNLE